MNNHVKEAIYRNKGIPLLLKKSEFWNYQELKCRTIIKLLTSKKK